MAAVGKLSYTPAATKVLRYSLEEAHSLNHDYVGSEHLLLGMLRNRDGVAAQALRKVGVELTAVRAAIVQLLGVTRLPRNVRDRCRRTFLSVPWAGQCLGSAHFFRRWHSGQCAVALVVLVVTVGPPPVLWGAVLVHLVIDIFAVASIFMLLLAISFWAGGSRWIDRPLGKIMPKGVVAVGAVLTALFFAVGIAAVADGLRIIGALGFVLGFLASIFLVAVPIINLIYEKIHIRLHQDTKGKDDEDQDL